jgi:hypothetical protein
MAIFDVLFEFCDNDSVFSTDSAVQSEDILDWGSGMTDLEMGAGSPMWLNIRVSTAFSGGTSAAFALVSDSDTTITNGTVLYTTPAIAVADLTVGTWVIRMPLPYDVDKERYTGIVVTCVGAVSAGAIDAWLDQGPQSSYDTQVATSNI